MIDTDYRLDIVIPGTPPMNASSSGNNRFARRPIKRKWEAWIKGAISRNIPSAPLQHAVVAITFYGSRALDYDNMVSGAKYILDALDRKHAGIIFDDGPKCIGRPQIGWRKSPRNDKRTLIEVVACEPEDLDMRPWNFTG